MTTFSSRLTVPAVHPAAAPQTIARRQQSVARLLGAPGYEHIDWRMLLSEGVLIRLHIGRCGFTTKLRLDDLGITPEDEQARNALSNLLILGEKRLLPERYMRALARIESAARYALKQRSFRTELGAFVPTTAYEAWRTETDRLSEKYFALRDEIISNYRVLTQEVLAEYEVVARDTYRRLQSTHPRLVSETEAQFLANYCNRIVTQIPTPEQIRTSFVFRYPPLESVAQVEALPAHEEDVPLHAADLRFEQDVRERGRVLMQQDLREQSHEHMQAVLDDFFSRLVSQVRVLTYDAVTDVLATLQRRGGESLAPRSVIQLKHLLTQLRELNFYGDQDIEQIMTRVQGIVDLSPTERKRSMQEVEHQLRAIATITRATLLDLEHEPRSARACFVPDVPTEALVREARLDLGLTVETLSSLPLEPREARWQSEWQPMLLSL